MSLWSMIGALVAPAKELAEVFTPNAEQQAERDHSERLALNEQDMAALRQFAAEFESKAARTAWDSFIDGLNRLPRPMITMGVLGLFVLAPLDPGRFLEIATAYGLIPDGMWALLSLIIAFYFGGRMQLSRQQMTVQGNAVRTLKELDRLRARRTEPPTGASAPGAAAEPVPAPTGAAPKTAAPKAATPAAGADAANRVIQEWQRRGRPYAA